MHRSEVLEAFDVVCNTREQKYVRERVLTYFIAAPPDRGWQRNQGLLLLHSFLSLDILVAFSILRFGAFAKRVS